MPSLRFCASLRRGFFDSQCPPGHHNCHQVIFRGYFLFKHLSSRAKSLHDSGSSNSCRERKLFDRSLTIPPDQTLKMPDLCTNSSNPPTKRTFVPPFPPHPYSHSFSFTPPCLFPRALPTPQVYHPLLNAFIRGPLIQRFQALHPLTQHHS
jgi:hypothetical protein